MDQSISSPLAIRMKHTNITLQGQKLSRSEWRALRRTVRRARRFGPGSIKAERGRLAQYRATVASVHSGTADAETLQQDDGFPYPVPAPLAEGMRVAVYTENATGKACTVSGACLFTKSGVSWRNSVFLEHSVATLSLSRSGSDEFHPSHKYLYAVEYGRRCSPRCCFSECHGRVERRGISRGWQRSFFSL